MLRKLLKKHRKPSTEESLPCELHTSSQQPQHPESLSTQARCGLQSADNDVLCTGWLEKSLPEKKLGHYAWKKRWFILRSGQMSGAPGVLEYYKNEHSKKPLQIINLNCTQLGIHVTFSKKELEKSFMFDIKTNERTFYLVAETEADRNRWVQSICQICGFSQTKESTDTLRNLSSVSHRLSSSRAEFSSSSQPLLQARRSSACSQSSQPRLTSHTQPASSTSAPQEHQQLHQCISRRRENARNASFSQSTRQESDTAAQKLAQGYRHCINRVSSQVHDFSSLPKPSQYSGFVPPRSLASHSHTKGSFTVSAADSKDVYTFKAPRNTPRREFGDLPMDSATAPPPLHPRTPRGISPKQRPPDSDYKYPTRGRGTTCWHDKSPKNTIMFQSDNASFSQSNVQESDTAAQKLAQGNRHSIHRVSSQVHDFYSLPKPSQYSGFDHPCSLASPSHTKPGFSVSASDSEDVYTFKEHRNTPCSEFGDLPVDSAIAPPPLPPKTHRGSSPQQRPPDSDYKYPTRDGETACCRDKSPKKTIVGLPNNASSDDNYVSMNPGPDIPMSTMPLHIASRGSENQPPPVYHHLKSGRKAKPEPLDLRNNTVINELPFKSPVTKPWSTVNNTFNPSSSQYCHSISITDSGDCEENYVPMQNPMSSSTVPSGCNNPAPKKSTVNVNSIDPDFQKPSPSPQHKPSTSSIISDEKGEYVQIDEEKNQALQKSIKESSKMQQS